MGGNVIETEIDNEIEKRDACCVDQVESLHLTPTYFPCPALLQRVRG